MIIVAGMHRSGTSMVARLFHESGADLGDPQTFYRPDRWNPDGYYEQPEIHAVNMPLINGPWNRLAYLRLPSTETIMRRARGRSAQLSRVIAVYRDCVIKDARFCLTLPAWLNAGAPVKGIVICLRNPLSVARSLRKRNWITLQHGCRLWQEHNRRLLKHSDGIPLWFVRFDHLIDPSRFQTELAPALRFAGIETDDQRIEALRGNVVKPSLDHFPESDDQLPSPIQQLWGELCRRHAAQTGDPARNGM